MVTRITPSLLALVAATVLAGCGDDEDNTTLAPTATTSVQESDAAGAAGGEQASNAGQPGETGPASDAKAPSYDQFIKRADRICAVHDKKIEAAEMKLMAGDPSAEEAEEFVRKVLIPHVQEEIDRVGAFTPPEGEEADVARILDAAQSAIDQLGQDPALIQGPDNPLAEPVALAKAYGFQVCG